MKFMPRILAALALCAFALTAAAQPATDCPCTVHYTVTAAGATPQTVHFTQPFALVPVCTAAFVNRPGDALTVTAAGRMSATVALGAGVAAFNSSDVLELSCVLSNRRH